MHHHDGPQGVANGNTDVTCWPSALTVVQSWDPELMAQYGAGMGLEQYKKVRPRLACCPTVALSRTRMSQSARASPLTPPP